MAFDKEAVRRELVALFGNPETVAVLVPYVERWYHQGAIDALDQVRERLLTTNHNLREERQRLEEEKTRLTHEARVTEEA